MAPFTYTYIRKSAGSDKLSPVKSNDKLVLLPLLNVILGTPPSVNSIASE